MSMPTRILGNDAAGLAVWDEALLAGLVQASPAVLYSCRVAADCGTIAVTSNAKRVLGFSPEEFIADPSLWAVRIHPEDSARVFEEMPKLFREGRQVIEYRFRRADGQYIWLRDHMTLELDNNGSPARILGCWIEIDGRPGSFVTRVVSEVENTKTVTVKQERYENQS
jgi:PAS domain S-box-containing protein